MTRYNLIQRYNRCIALVSDTSIQTDTLYRMYHHPSEQVLANVAAQAQGVERAHLLAMVAATQSGGLHRLFRPAQRLLHVHVLH